MDSKELLDKILTWEYRAGESFIDYLRVMKKITQSSVIGLKSTVVAIPVTLRLLILNK